MGRAATRVTRRWFAPEAAAESSGSTSTSPAATTIRDFERVGWDEFFKVFDDSDVAFLHGEGDSRFNKFVAKESAEG